MILYFRSTALLGVPPNNTTDLGLDALFFILFSIYSIQSFNKNTKLNKRGSEWFSICQIRKVQGFHEVKNSYLRRRFRHFLYIYFIISQTQVLYLALKGMQFSRLLFSFTVIHSYSSSPSTFSFEWTFSMVFLVFGNHKHALKAVLLTCPKNFIVVNF